MSRESIFIASSREAQETAKLLAQELAAHKYRPIRWWTAFKLGDFTFSRLREIAKTVDCAVFLITPDDKKWYRDDSVSSPRDNVVLEFGLFAARLDLDRCLLIRSPSAQLPTDLHGVTYLELQDDVTSVGEKLVAHLSTVFGSMSLPLRLESIAILSDPDVTALLGKRDLPSTWLMRALYIGLEGARAWLDITRDPDYESLADQVDLRRTIGSLLDGTTAAFRTFVSLGPGDGRLDAEIAQQLKRREAMLQYIPVDISDGLLSYAYERVAQHVRVPVGLLTDFEERLNFVIHHAHRYGSPPYFYGLFGNTFGNLDLNENNFVEGLRTCLGPDDCLMMEVAVLQEERTDLDLRKMGDGARSFFAKGAARILNLRYTDVLKRFDEIVHVDVDQRDRRSDVANTKRIELSALDVDGKLRMFAFSRRYDQKSLMSYLEEFGGLHVTPLLIKSEHEYNSCVMLLRQRSSK